MHAQGIVFENALLGGGIFSPMYLSSTNLNWGGEVGIYGHFKINWNALIGWHKYIYLPTPTGLSNWNCLTRFFDQIIFKHAKQYYFPKYCNLQCSSNLVHLKKLYINIKIVKKSMLELVLFGGGGGGGVKTDAVLSYILIFWMRLIWLSNRI